MAINWFEGGRRIVAAIGALVVLGSLIYLFAAGSGNRVVLESSSPNERLRWTLNECDYPDFEKAWDSATEFELGDPRRVVMCLRAKSNGKIEYSLSPEAEASIPVRSGQPPLPPVKMRRTFEANAVSDEVERYALTRMKAFAFTQREFEAIAAGQWKIGVVRFCERAIDALQWVVGLIVGLWGAAAVIGWLIRGFAGIPNGRDFMMDDRNNTARMNRASLGWLITAIAGWCLLAGLAWIVLAALTPGTTPLGSMISKTAGFVGYIVLVVIGFTAFIGGGVGLRTLAVRLLKSEEADWATGDTSAIAFSIANGILVAFVAVPLNIFTFIGTLTNAVEQWSRTNGHADGGVMGLFAFSLLWPFIPLALLSRFDATKETETDGV